MSQTDIISLHNWYVVWCNAPFWLPAPTFAATLTAMFVVLCAVWSCPKIVNINFFGWKAIHIQFWQASSAGDTISHFTKNENSLFVAFTFNFVTKNRCPCKWSFCIIELQIQIQIPGMIVDKVRVTSHRNFSIIIDGSARERGERDLMANSWLTRTIRKNCIELSIVRIRDN